MNRAQLLSLQPDSTVSTLQLCIAVLAWGGMRGSNRNHLFSRPTAPWLEIATDVRKGELSRAMAFDAFAKLNATKALLGMGPAYYTKLIYFLMPRTDAGPIGYIMDQWLGCSINLLFDKDIVLMDENIVWVPTEGVAHAERAASSRVSPLNTGDHYERFCLAVEILAERMGSGWTPESTELALLSKGGRRHGQWRAHVVGSRLGALAGK